jgi:hypothetical protein
VLAANLRALPGLALLGCAVGGAATAYKTYSGPRKPDAEVALLIGQVAFIDGEPVQQHGQRFALEPGCHVVRLPNKVYDSDSTESITGTLPPTHFALPVKASHMYQVRVRVPHMSGAGSGGLVIEVIEHDATHEQVGKYPALYGEGDYGMCTLEAAATAKAKAASEAR